MANATRAQELVRKIESDPKFGAQIAAASGQAEKKRILQQAGFGDVTEEDVMAYHKQAAPQLSDADLEQVAGGTDTITTTTTTTTVFAGASAAVAAG